MAVPAALPVYTFLHMLSPVPQQSLQRGSVVCLNAHSRID